MRSDCRARCGWSPRSPSCRAQSLVSAWTKRCSVERPERTESEDAMASTCPVDLDTLRLRAEIESIYRRVATEPGGDFHFHRGPTYAAEMLGYDAVALALLPADSTASFAGVANPHRIAPMTPGATVVDIGCGAGMDLMLAGEAVG